MPKPLWAPWRLEYIGQADADDGCVFCREAREELAESESLVVSRGELAFALLNKFPYSSGHLLVAPVRHESELRGLSEDEVLAMHRLSVEALDALARTATRSPRSGDGPRKERPGPTAASGARPFVSAASGGRVRGES